MRSRVEDTREVISGERGGAETSYFPESSSVRDIRHPPLSLS